jgi:F-type H+-transporting ATPase subunit b
MELVKPELGLIFWMLVTFIIVLTLLKKFAWGPILGIIKERETSIENALNAAEKARHEMKNLQSANEKLLADARLERDQLMKEAREMRESMINEAKTKASSEADRIVSAAREQINNEKMAAISELKSQVATLSIDIAEKIIKAELTNEDKQKALISNLVNDIKLN